MKKIIESYRNLNLWAQSYVKPSSFLVVVLELFSLL